MTYAYVVDNAVQRVSFEPSNMVRRDTGDKPLFSPYIDTATLNACGWYLVSDPGAPVIDPATQVVQPRVAVYSSQSNTVAYVYTVRAKTQAELDADADAAQTALERQQARDAIADLDAFLALSAPTNAQTLTVVKLLCRIAKRLIRDALGG